MYIAILGIITGAFGTILALRLMAIDAQEHGIKLTVRGRVVVGLLCGLAIALVVMVMNGVWWDCDLRAGATTPCVVHWSW